MKVVPGLVTESTLRWALSRQPALHKKKERKATYNPLSNALGPTPPGGGGQGDVKVVVVAESASHTGVNTRQVRGGGGIRTVPGEVGERDSVPDGGEDLVRSERERVRKADLDDPVLAYDEGRRGDEDESGRDD